MKLSPQLSRELSLRGHLLENACYCELASTRTPLSTNGPSFDRLQFKLPMSHYEAQAYAPIHNNGRTS